jgi:hypothetical protein
MKLNLSLLLLLLTFCAGCKKGAASEGNVDTALNGTWVKEALNSSVAGSKESIEISANGDISINGYYVNPSTQQILGYAYRYTGKYRVTGNGLIELYNLSASVNKTSDPYVAIDKLTSTSTLTQQQYTYQLNNVKTTLNWTVVCPPYADCIGTQQYTKQ